MSLSSESKVDDLIKQNKVMVFSKSYCPYCTRAKELLKSKGIDFCVVELDKMDDGRAIQDFLKQKTGQSTVPSIFINGKHIGGCDDLLKLDKQGKLLV